MRQVRRRKSPAFRAALTAASYLTLLLLAYAGFKMVVLGFKLATWSLWLGWEAAGALLSATLFTLDVVFWTPRLVSSLLLSGLMRKPPSLCRAQVEMLFALHANGVQKQRQHVKCGTSKL